MYPCKANREGEYCEMPAEKGGYCRYHQKILPKNKKVYPCMKSHKSKKYQKNVNVLDISHDESLKLTERIQRGLF
jgi:hypothetical protein